MIKLCPLMAFRMNNPLGGEVKCLGVECALADENGKCLIKQFLELRVYESLREKKAVETYWATKKNGTSQPFSFPPTKDVFVDSRALNDETPKFKPPRCD